MFFRLLALLIVVPFIELILLLRLADATSWLTTLLIVVITGIIGSFLARREGLATWFRFQSAMSQGKMPSREIQDGLMIAFAAALLLTPGLLTDALGFTLLTPPGRRLIGGWLRHRFAGSFQMRTFGGGGSGSSTGPSIQDGFGQRGFNQNGSDSSGQRSGGAGDTIDSPHFEPKQSPSP
ncbi:FxsA cytoplasmic membrane protein [Rhodopirellula baltica SH28]|uniref:FxsA cytoplasmic membrane protein n=1 Tax=Rhodopirellula baltica SH28 TaxID=993517 RepID=K5D2D7_RHOBT|nr:FxsA family protein [Rhodopirellula baltica]EKK00722.1 FxsA cytoplasmic membrane protein [Rhodopirellula baltica SH28]